MPVIAPIVAPILIYDRRTNQVASGRLPAANVRLPCDRGSLPALLAALARVLKWNPQASVVLRSHRAPQPWLAGLQRQQQLALDLVRHAPDELVIMAMRPVDKLSKNGSCDGAWVRTEATSWPGLSRAGHIDPQPRNLNKTQGGTLDDADLMFSGTLVGQAATVWSIADRLWPTLTASLVPLLAARDLSQELLAAVYPGDGKFELCRDLIARCPERLWVQEIQPPLSVADAGVAGAGVADAAVADKSALSGNAAVDDEFGAGDVTRFIAGEKQHAVGYV